MHKENRPTSSCGRVSCPQEVEGWSEVSTRFLYTPFLYIRPLAQTNASKAVPFSKSDWTLSRHWADSASAAKKFFSP